MESKASFDNTQLLTRFKKWCYGCLDIIQDRNSVHTSDLRKEADELLRIVVSSIATVRRNT